MTAGHIVGAVLAGGTVLASALLLGLGRAGRVLHTRLDDWLVVLVKDHRLRARIVFAVLYPALVAYALCLWAINRRTRSSR